MLTSPAPAWLVLLELTPQGYTYLGNLVVIGVTEMDISILISILTWVLNSPLSSAILRDFRDQKYRFTVPKIRTWLLERQEEEHRQLQSVMRFSQMQKLYTIIKTCKCKLEDLFTRFGTFTHSCVTLIMNFLQSFQKFLSHSFLFLYSQIWRFYNQIVCALKLYLMFLNHQAHHLLMKIMEPVGKMIQS